MVPLKAAGHDVIWAGDWLEDPGDEEILALAYKEGRILVTLDKDFGELVVVREQAHAGMIRLVVLSASQQAPTCLMVLDRYGTELQSVPASRSAGAQPAGSSRRGQPSSSSCYLSDLGPLIPRKMSSM